MPKDHDRKTNALRELDAAGVPYLKKAAAAVGEKAVAMLPARELLPLTGYVHGGCSPIGMRRPFPTAIDETADLFERIAFSGGRLGCQVEMAPDDLARVVPLVRADLTVV